MLLLESSDDLCLAIISDPVSPFKDLRFSKRKASSSLSEPPSLKAIFIIDLKLSEPPTEKYINAPW
jgi:hypothetical protein